MNVHIIVIQMFPPVVCSCGNCIGSLYLLFIEKRTAYIKKYIEENKVDVSPDNWMNADLDINIEHIFVELGLDLVCCREKINCNLEFKTFLN